MAEVNCPNCRGSGLIRLRVKGPQSLCGRCQGTGIIDDGQRAVNAQLMRALEYQGKQIGDLLGMALKPFPGCGFALFIFSYDGPEFTWISNTQRKDMIKALQEFIARNPPDQVQADRN